MGIPQGEQGQMASLSELSQELEAIASVLDSKTERLSQMAYRLGVEAVRIEREKNNMEWMKAQIALKPQLGETWTDTKTGKRLIVQENASEDDGPSVENSKGFKPSPKQMTNIGS